MQVICLILREEQYAWRLERIGRTSIVTRFSRWRLTHLGQVIGEAARQVSPDFRAKHPEIRWICTDEGLSRFDEREFRTYTRQNGIPHIHVNAILETRDGEYWIATDGGVARFHPRDPGKQFESFDRGPGSQTGDDSSRCSFNSCRVSIVFRPKRC